ncbi:NADP oxidoreductase [Rhodothermaceae bacterium RA]|nr:NADP oxidoreductase [Rhodothermaceae bacterium RA]
MSVPVLHDARRPPVALVGAGRLGSALARRLHAAGYPVAAVASRTEAAARALAALLPGAEVLRPGAALPEAVRLVFCCVPDEALPSVARHLASLEHPWAATVVAHTSGALTAGVLAPLVERGAAAMSFHPVQAFPPSADPSVFEGIVIGLEGAARAVALGREVARDLGARPVELAATDKARYHLAASVASNFFVTLMALAGEVLGSIGLSRSESAALLRPLVEGTWHNLREGLPEDVLTGPIVRGDAATIERHVQALAEHLPHLLPVYAALATETVRVAVRGAHLPPEEARRLLDTLHAAVDPPPDALFDG